jgi:hypothetical protein
MKKPFVSHIGGSTEETMLTEDRHSGGKEWKLVLKIMANGRIRCLHAGNINQTKNSNAGAASEPALYQPTLRPYRTQTR